MTEQARDYIVRFTLELEVRCESMLDEDMASQYANDQLCLQVLPGIERSDFYWEQIKETVVEAVEWRSCMSDKHPFHWDHNGTGDWHCNAHEGCACLPRQQDVPSSDM